jgi:hypothetical protein
MRKIGLAIILAATALTACEREGTKTTSADTVSLTATGASYTGRAERRDARLQSKLAAPAMPAPPAALMDASEAVTGQVEGNAVSRASSSGAPIDRVQSFGTATSSTMLIRTGQAFVEVEKLDPAILKIRQLVAQVGGYITNSSMSGGRDQIRQASIEIKIPNTQYDQAVGSLSSIGKVETVNSSAQDVGEEFVDVTARMANARRLEDRLINLLDRRTGKLDEVLRVERELARVREEIERYDGRLRYLSARVAMSTLTINAHEPAPVIEPGSNPIGEAFRHAWQNFVAMLAAVIASLGVLIPIGLIGVGGWIGYRKWVKGNRPLTA